MEFEPYKEISSNRTCSYMIQVHIDGVDPYKAQELNVIQDRIKEMIMNNADLLNSKPKCVKVDINVLRGV